MFLTCMHIIVVVFTVIITIFYILILAGVYIAEKVRITIFDGVKVDWSCNSCMFTIIIIAPLYTACYKKQSSNQFKQPIYCKLVHTY